MKRLLVFISLPFIFCGITENAAAFLSRQSPEIAIRATLEQLFDAYRKKDAKTQGPIWSLNAPGRTKDAVPDLSIPGDLQIESININRINVDQSGGKADIRVVVDLGQTGSQARNSGDKPTKKNLTVHMVKESGEWKLWECVPSERELASRIVSANTDEERNVLLQANEDLLTTDLEAELLKEGRSLLLKGPFPKAADIFILLANLAGKLGDKRTQSISLGNVGRSYELQGNYERAIDYLLKTIDVAREISFEKVLSHALYGAGLIQQRLGNYAEALNLIQQGLDVAEAANDTPNIAWALQNLAAVHLRQGHNSQAVKELLRSLDLAQKTNDQRLAAGCLHQLGVIEFHEANMAQAQGYFERCLNLAKEISDEEIVMNALDELGSVAAWFQDLPKAIQNYQQSLDLARKRGDKEHIATTLHNLGSLYWGKHDNANALRYYEESLEYHKQTENRQGRADTAVNIAQVYYDQGLFDKALKTAENSASEAGKIGDVETIANAWTLVGDCHRSLKEPEEARRSFEAAIAAIEELRSHIAGADDRQQFMALRVSPYDEIARLLIEQAKPLEALGYAEQARARTLMDVLQSGGANIGKKMTPQERAEEERLTAQLGVLNSDVIRENAAANPDPAKLAGMNAKLSQVRLDFDRFRKDLYAAHPELQVQRGQFQPTTPKQLAGLIQGPKTAVLEYMVTDDLAYLFVLTERSLAQETPDTKVYSIPSGSKELKELTARFRKSLEARDLGVREQSLALFKLLLGQAAPDIAAKTELLIVPDGPLWELPFQALESRPNHFTVEDYAISYAPSLTALREMLKPHKTLTNRAGGLRLLAMGNPTIGADTASNVKDTFRGAALEPLPRAEDEVETIAGAYGAARSKVYVRGEATEERFKTEASNCSILHLATHGILDDENPMYSQIVLARAAGGKEDGVLEAWELANPNLSADLIVLSACDSGRGEVRAGEGVIGLSWAVFVGGCPTTVVSQWKVESASTTELMVAFHRNLLAGKSKAEALREAELKLLNDPTYRHPFYWAPFVIVGNPN